MTTLVQARTLLAHLFAITLAFLVVVGAYATQPILLVSSRFQPRVQKTHGVEAAPHAPRALGQDIELAFDANKDDSKDEDLSDLVEAVPEFHQMGAPSLGNNEDLKDWVSVCDIPLPPPDAAEEEELRTRLPLFVRRRGLSKRFLVHEEDSLPPGRSTRDYQEDEGDHGDWSSEDLGIDEAYESTEEDLKVLDSIPLPSEE